MTIKLYDILLEARTFEHTKPDTVVDVWWDSRMVLEVPVYKFINHEFAVDGQTFMTLLNHFDRLAKNQSMRWNSSIDWSVF